MLVFSRVELKNDEGKSVNFIFSGSPRTLEEFKGFIPYECFADASKTIVSMSVKTYGYGEGDKFDATPEEVAYLTMRYKRADEDNAENNRFLKYSCHFIKKYSVNF